MNDFEMFDLRAWLVDGLFTRHVPRAKPRAAKRTGREGSERARFAIPLAGAVASLHLLSAPASAQSTARVDGTVPASVVTQTGQDMIPGDPKIFWAKLVSDIKRRPRAIESSSSDPDPLF